jgi:hypothetical protein
MPQLVVRDLSLAGCEPRVIKQESAGWLSAAVAWGVCLCACAWVLQRVWEQGELESAVICVLMPSLADERVLVSHLPSVMYDVLAVLSSVQYVRGGEVDL